MKKILKQLLAVVCIVTFTNPILKYTIGYTATTNYNNENIDLTNVALDSSISHSHIWVDERDDTYHWRRCTVCNAIEGKANHNLTTRYTVADPSQTCDLHNKKIVSCSCGYSKTTSAPGTKPHTPDVGEPFNFCGDISRKHGYYCSSCMEFHGYEDCYIEEGGAKKYLKNMEIYVGCTCAGCGRLYTKKMSRLSSPKAEVYISLDNQNVVYKWEVTMDDGLGKNDLKNANTDMCLMYNADNGDINREYFPPTTLEFDGDKAILTYVVPVRDVSRKYYYSIKAYNRLSLENSQEYIRYYGSETSISTNLTDPQITNVYLKNSSGTNLGDNSGKAFVKNPTLEIEGKIVGSYNGYASLYDSAGKVVFKDKMFDIGADNKFKASIKINNTECVSDNYKVVVKDYFGKEVSVIKTLHNIDALPPSVGTITVPDEWSKAKKVTFTMQDGGNGNVKTAINKTEAYGNTTKQGDKYLKDYTFTGDIYTPKNCVIYAKDGITNYGSTIFSIGKIDNTAPNITSIAKSTTDVSKNITLTATTDDINASLNQSGCGGLQYKFTSTDADVNSRNDALNKWSSSPSVSIIENGQYYLEVKDALGNLRDSRDSNNPSIPDIENLKVENVDTKVPEIYLDIKNSDDGSGDDDDDDSGSGKKPGSNQTTITISSGGSSGHKEPYMTGFKDGTFRPNEPITRGEVAAIFSRIDKRYDDYTRYKVRFPDVTGWAYNYIGFCDKSHIMIGYPDGLFRSTQAITKAEFTAALVRSQNLKQESNSRFADVKGRWFEGYVATLEKNGGVLGRPDGTYGSDKYITRAEAVKLVNAACDREISSKELQDYKNKFKDVNETSWYYKDVVNAIKD